MKKYLVKSKLGIGRDFSVFDDEEGNNLVFKIDAKIGFGSKAEIKGANNNVIYTAKGKFFNIPRRMEFFNTDGGVVANLKARISPIKSRLTMEITKGGVWELSGNFVGKNYTVMQDDKKILEINQKWMTIRDKYFVEIAEDADIALALGLIWAVDVWREGNNN
jgi:uncharacterized protein YxjI